MTFRRALCVLILAILVALCVKSRLLLMPFIDREPYVRERVPDREWPRYPRFLAGVLAHTSPGDSIAIVAPAMHWDNGYSYAYYRASYLLAGREVLPLVDGKDERLVQNLHDARYIAAFGMLVNLPVDVVWQGEGGVLLRPKWRAAPASAPLRNQVRKQ